MQQSNIINELQRKKGLGRFLTWQYPSASVVCASAIRGGVGYTFRREEAISLQD
jgi:hypothetical protein